MSDFYQHRAVTTLHQLGGLGFDRINAALVEYAKAKPITLVMPALFSEVEGALHGIVEQIAAVDFIDEVVVSMNQMEPAEFARARTFFDRLPQQHHLIWNDGPHLGEVYRALDGAGVTGYVPGKGCNVWMAYGFALAKGCAGAIVTHDSDILSYGREMLARLCLPAVHPELAYDYCKSFYGRVSDRMYGRVTRLFVTPLLRAMIDVFGRLPLLEFLEGFRYPLSGEFAISADLAARVRMPGDWGLEVGMLAEVYRDTALAKICQVELGGNFDHKHQGLSPDVGKGSGNGLGHMAQEIAASLFASARAEGADISLASLDDVAATYNRLAGELIVRYGHDSLLNGLRYDPVEEAAAVAVFGARLLEAGRLFVAGELLDKQIPSWAEARAALPDIDARVLAAVGADNF